MTKISFTLQKSIASEILGRSKVAIIVETILKYMHVVMVSTDVQEYMAHIHYVYEIEPTGSFSHHY